MGWAWPKIHNGLNGSPTQLYSWPKAPALSPNFTISLGFLHKLNSRYLNESVHGPFLWNSWQWTEFVNSLPLLLVEPINRELPITLLRNKQSRWVYADIVVCGEWVKRASEEFLGNFTSNSWEDIWVLETQIFSK